VNGRIRRLHWGCGDNVVPGIALDNRERETLFIEAEK